MKNRNNKKYLLLLITIIILLVVVFSLTLIGNKKVKKSFAIDTGIKNISQFIDTDDNPTSVSFVLEYLDHDSKENVSDNEVEVTVPSEIKLSFIDSNTNKPINSQNNKVTLGDNGVIVKLNGIEKGNTYNITVKPTEKREGYKPSYKEATIEINYEDELTASVKRIIDKDNNDVELSENDKMVFLFTDDEDKIKLRGNQDVEIMYYYSTTQLSDEELQNVAFTEYNKDNYLSVSTNGYLYAKSRYKTSGYSKINSLHITNIDKLAPVVTTNSIVESATYDSATITYNVSDAASTDENAKSGVVKYAFSNTNIEDNVNYIDVNGDGTYTETVYDNRIYYVFAIDKAGNKTVQEIDVNNISFYQEEKVVFIIGSNIPELVGKSYNSLQAMKADFDAHNLTNNDRVVAQIESDIMNQYIDVENVNLTIDLNGYEIYSREEHPTFTVKDGATLKVVDKKLELGNILDYNNENYYCMGIDEELKYSALSREQTLTINSDSFYKVELWGAQGGYRSNENNGGKGAYVGGIIHLNQNDVLHINVGSSGNNSGWNGGGTRTNDLPGGGGATDIRINSDSLYARAMVAAGGGSDGASNKPGGYAGGLTGQSRTESYGSGGTGATQTAGGTYRGEFGQGGSGGDWSGGHAGAGGGGWYGGGAANPDSSSDDDRGGGGGSSYIFTDSSEIVDGYLLNDQYKVYDSTMIDGNGLVPSIIGAYTSVGNSGDGYAKISKLTCVKTTLDSNIDIQHGTKNGMINNVNHDAILVENGGTFILGEDNTVDMAHIETPSIVTPIIQGKEKAITNRGNFEFYDGYVFGGVAIDGNISNTPSLYDPLISIDEDTGNYKMTLTIVSNVEALIGKTRYTLLEDAIAAANERKGTPEDQIRIDVVTDLVKTETIDISNIKNIILDLNGHSITTTNKGYVFNNNGKLVIMDSGDTGSINKDNDNTIHNNNGAFLTIQSGNINNSFKGGFNIINEETGNLDVQGGTLVKSSDGSVILNYGTFNFNDGFLIKYDYNGQDVNNQGGTVNFNKGKIICNSSVSPLINNDLSSSSVVNNSSPVPLTSFNSSYSNRIFTRNEIEGSLEPSSYTSYNNYYDDYYILDLRSYSSLYNFKFSFKVLANIPDNVYAYYYARNDTSRNNYNSSYNTYFKNTNWEYDEYTYTYEGGKIYYLHFGYFKYTRDDISEDTIYKIKDIKVDEMLVNPGRVVINKDVTYESNNGSNIPIYNYSNFDNFVINDANFSNVQLYEYNVGKMIIHDGAFYNITNQYGGNIEIDNGTFNNYIYNYNGTITIHDGTFNGTIYNSSTTSNIALGSIDYPKNNTSNIYIKGGTFNELINVHYANIKDATFVGSLNNYSIQETNIDNTTFYKHIVNTNSGYTSVNILTNEGITNMTNCKFDVELTANSTSYSNNNAYPYYFGIYKNGSSTLNISNLDFDSNITKSNENYTNTRFSSTDYITIAIYDDGSGIINLDKSNIILSVDTTERNTYGLYLNGVGKINIGVKNNVYNHDDIEIITDYPIFNRDEEINFYDGVLKGNKGYLNTSVSDVETNYYIHTYEDSSYKIMDLNQTVESVLNIDTGDKYSSLYDALRLTTGNSNFRYIGSINYENNSINISEGRTINVDLNGKKILFGQGIINNGELKLYDDSSSIAKVNTHQIINNNILNINNGEYTFEIENLSGLINDGLLNITNSSLKLNSNNKNNLIYNNNTINVNNNALLTLNGYFRGRLIYNNIDSELYINGGTIDASEPYSWGSHYHSDYLYHGRAIYNNGGYVELNTGAIKTYSVYNDYNYGRTFGIANYSTTGQKVEGFDNTNLFPSGSYIPVDLTEYEGNVEIETKYFETYHYNDGSYNVYIREEQSIPSGTTPDISFPRDGKTHSSKNTLVGGKTYYFYIDNSNLKLSSILIKYNNEVIDLHHRGVININGGSLIESGSSYAMYSNNAIVNMTNGSIKRDSGIGSQLFFENGSEFNMTGGEILDFGTAINTDNGAVLNLLGGKIGYSDLTNNLGTNATGVNLRYSTVNMKNYTINIPGTGVSSTYSSTINIDDSDIYMTGVNNQTGISSTYFTNINIKDSSIIASSSSNNSYGITTSETNDIIVNNTYIDASRAATNKGAYGINTSVNTILTLTNDDGNEDGKVSQITPSIKGDTCGIVSNGTFNYYDGILKGETPLSGGVSDKPQKYELLYGTEEGLNTVVLQKTVVVQNKDTLEEYGLLQDGIDACPKNSKCRLKILYPIDFTEQVEIDDDLIIDLDLNKFILSCTEQKNIVNKGELTLTNGTIKFNNVKDYTAIIENYGKLVLDNGTILDMNSTYFARGIMNKYTGSVYIEPGSHIKAWDAGVPYAGTTSGRTIYNEGGYIEMNGGIIDTASIYGYSNCSGCFSFNNTSFVNTSIGDENDSSITHRAKFVLNDGTINGRGGRDYFSIVNSDFEMNGGIINGSKDSDNAIHLTSNSNFKMTDGIIQNKSTGIYSENSDLEFDGGYIYSKESKGSYGIGSLSGSNLTINDVHVEGAFTYGLYISSITSVVNGGTYINTSSDSNSAAVYVTPYSSSSNYNHVFDNIIVEAGLYGFNIGSTSVTIKNSEITSNNTAINCLFNNECKITVSNNDDSISTTKSLISGNVYGINHTAGEINFYDGIIKGNTSAVVGGINSIPDNAQLIYDVEDDKNVIYLGENNIVKNVTTNVQYDRLQKAVDSCLDNERCELQVLSNINMIEKLDIPNNKVIDLDINNKTITTVGNNNFVNHGVLTIRNGNIRVNSVIDYTAIFDNYGTLYIEDGANIDNTGNLRSRLIYNEYDSNLIINGGVLRNRNSTSHPDYFYNVYGGTIYNAGGYVEINDGTFEVNSSRSPYYQNIGATSIYAIYNVKTVPSYIVYTDMWEPSINDGIIHGEHTGIYIPVDLTNKTGKYYITVHASGSPYLCNQPEGDGTYITNVSNSMYKTQLLDGGKIYYVRLYTNSFAGSFNVYNIYIDNEEETERENLFKRGKIVINGGNLYNYGGLAFITSANSDVEMNNGIIQSSSTSMGGPAFSLNNGSKLTMNDGKLINRSDAITVSGSSYANLLGGKIETNIGYGGSAINVKNGTVDIENTKMELLSVSASSDNILRGIVIQENGTVNFKNGELTTNNGTNSQGIYLSNNSATLNLGSNDGDVSETTPSIRSDVYGVYKYAENSTFNYYDGIITATGKPIYGDVDDMPENYKIAIDGNSYILKPKSSIENTYEYNGVFFERLDMAIEFINQTENKTGMIKVWNDVTLNSNITIPSGANITLALEDHEISFENVEVGITNYGTLTIVDGETNEIDNGFRSKIKNVNGTVIDNQGSLTLGASGMSNANSPIITGNVGYTGNTPTIVSGSIESTSTGIIESLANMGKRFILFITNLFKPTYAYKTNDYQVNNLDSNVVLSDSPSIKAVDSLDTYTNEDINIALTAHNYGVLNIVSSVDEDQTKEIKYTVEIYKNDNKDDGETVEKTKTIQSLDNSNIEVDVDYFEKANSMYEGLYLYKVVINDVELPVNNGVVEIEPTVANGTVFKLYYKTIPVTTTTTTTTDTTSTTTKKAVKTTKKVTKKTTKAKTTTTTETSTSSSNRTTEVKGDEVVIRVKGKKKFPWWIFVLILGGTILGILLSLLPVIFKKTVLIGISGSVGSAVATKLLLERKYKVSALFIDNTFNVQALNNAKQVCDKLKIPLYIKVIDKEYKKKISEAIITNPKVDLDNIYNKYILIDMLRSMAKEKHIKYISTGLYAISNNGEIEPAINKVFDQSSDLSLLTDEDIKQLILPLGEIEYHDIVKIANEYGINYNSESQNAIEKIGKNNLPKEIKTKSKK